MRAIVPAALALLCLAPVPAMAEWGDYTVACDGVTPNQLSNTLSGIAAADRLDGPSTVTVSGVCPETRPVPIDQFTRLVIVAPDGAKIVSTSPTHAVRIVNSRDVHLIGLDISGATRTGVNVFDSTSVTLEGCSVHDNTRNGVAVFQNSDLQVFGGSFRNNGFNGFSVNQSRLGVDSAEIAGNRSGGINANDSSSLVATNLTVRDNRGFGIIVFHVTNLILAGSTITGNDEAGVRVSETSHGEIFGGNVIRNNGARTGDGGVYVSEHGEVFLGENDISNNAGHGVRGSAQASISGEGGNTITGNGGDGVRLDRGSFEQFLATDTIANNGRANVRCDSVSWIAGDPGVNQKVECKRVEPTEGEGRRASRDHGRAARAEARERD